MKADSRHQETRHSQSTGSLLVWIILFSLIPQGLTIAVSDRTPTIAVSDVVMILVLGGCILSAIFGSFRFNVTEGKLLALSAAYILANLASFFANPTDVLRSILAIKVFLFGLLTYVIVRSVVNSWRSWDSGMNALICWGVAISVLLAYQLLTKWQFSFEKDEVGIAMGRSNYLAAMLLPIVPVAAFRIAERKGLLRVPYIFGAGFVFLGLLITSSRGALLSLALTFLVMLPVLLKAGLRLWHVLAVVLGLGLIVLALPAEVLQTYAEMIAYRVATPDFNRIELWTVAWNSFVQHPLLGVGPNVIYVYNKQFAIEDLYSHNYVLNVLADVGLVGFVPFALLISALVLRSLRLCYRTFRIPTFRPASIGFLFALAVTLAHGLVEPTFQGQQYLVVFWTFIALMHSFEHLSSIDHAFKM